MSGIGIVVRADGQIETLGPDWTPESLGTRSEVLAVVARRLPKDNASLAPRLGVEAADRSDRPARSRPRASGGSRSGRPAVDLRRPGGSLP